jgi:hypothetical protein
MYLYVLLLFETRDFFFLMREEKWASFIYGETYMKDAAVS